MHHFATHNGLAETVALKKWSVITATKRRFST